MRIQTRIIGAAMLVVLVVNILYTLYFIGRERKDATTRLRTTIEENDRLLKVVTAGPLYDGNVEQLNTDLDSFFLNPDMVRLVLKEYNGTIRITREREPAAAVGDVVTSRVVITRGVDELGEITTTYSTALIEERLLKSRDQIVLFSCILVLGLSVVIYLVAKGLTGPIDRLTAAARAMADGELDREIETSGAQELSILGHSFIRMRDAIRAKMTDLAAQNEAMRLKDMAIASAINGIAIAGPDGLLTYVNSSFLRLWGYDDAAQVLGKPTAQFWQSEEKAAQVMETALTQGGGFGELVAKRKDGSLFSVEYSASLVKDEAGRTAYLMGSFVDITERKRAEEEKAKLEAQLLQAQKMESIGRLAGGVAHDFNNMLTVILGYAVLAKRRLPAGDSLEPYLREIERAAMRSRDLTRQLLAFSRKQVITPRIVNLNDLVASTQKTLPRLIGEDVELRFIPTTGLWNIKIDPLQVDQIIMNLAVNARDAMPNGGTLTVETANVHLDEEYCRRHAGFLPGSYVLLTVSDTGIGMDKEVLAHLFEPFFTTKEFGKGTGLGLATVYGIVKQNNGFINVYSEAGQGTAVKIYLPRAAEETALTEAPAPASAPSGAGTILLVEDDAMVREFTTQLLKTLGYSVLAADSPAHALSLCQREDTPIDLLMTDVVMPGMNGKELMRKVEAIRPGIRVLFMSGYTANVIAHHGVLDKGIRFIQKPFTLDDLARKVREAMADL
jgi:PAS domain S-box-containing protein